MIQRQLLLDQIPYTLQETNFSKFGSRYIGKVRDSYVQGENRIIITTDRLSCFDRVVTSVPFKGQVLNELAVYWFNKSKHIVANHLLDVPDPNVMVVQECEVLPIEVVVRGYLAGSAARDYAAGRKVSGIALPPGLRESEKLPEILLTPSTKAEKGSHDTPISEEEILKRGIVPAAQWEEVREIAKQLFQFGQSEAEKVGLLLVDTKYEFGVRKGKVVLVDEIHTLDSSRYWVQANYQERFSRGEQPEMLDKEPTRRWLLERGFMGDGEIPEFTDAHRVDLAVHYISSFERIAGKEFHPERGDATARIEHNLIKAGGYKV